MIVSQWARGGVSICRNQNVRIDRYSVGSELEAELCVCCCNHRARNCCCVGLADDRDATEVISRSASSSVGRPVGKLWPYDGACQVFVDDNRREKHFPEWMAEGRRRLHSHQPHAVWLRREGADLRGGGHHGKQPWKRDQRGRCCRGRALRHRVRYWGSGRQYIGCRG